MILLESSDTVVQAKAQGEIVLRSSETLPLLMGSLQGANTTLASLSAELLEKIAAPESQKAVADYRKQQVLKKIKEYIKDLRTDGTTINMAAVEALSKIGAPAVPALTQALKDTSVGVRGGAAKTLNTLGRDAAPATQALIQTLEDKDATVRHESAEALEKIGTPEAKKPLTMYRWKEKARGLLHR